MAGPRGVSGVSVAATRTTSRNHEPGVETCRTQRRGEVHPVNPETELAHATPDSAPFVAGRRDFLKYRDLGVTKASRGRMRAQVTVATGEMKETGWHYHVCDSQFVYGIKGWVDLEFEDGRKIRLKAGKSCSSQAA